MLFKNGKLSLEDNKVIKSNIENRAEKCFKRGHKGSCIISVRLKEEKTGNRGNANYAKLIDLVVRKGWRPEEATKTGFKSADLQYNEVERANRVYKEMLRIEDIECNILDKNLEAWGVIQDWDDKVVHLAETIDDKKYFNSLERITYRKYDNEVKDKFETVVTKNILVKFNGRSVPEYITLYGGLVKIKVRPYIPAVKQCFNCYGYGHTKANCKRKKKICLICGEEYHGVCERAYSCINCKENHKANDKKCQIYIKNKEIMKTMVEKKITIYEAKKNMQQMRPSNTWEKPLEWPSLEKRENKQYRGQENRERDKRDYTNGTTTKRRERDIWQDRNEREKEEKERQDIHDKKEVSTEKYEIKEICAEFENIIKKIIKANVNKNFIQEDLLKEIERNLEECYNLIKKEVKKGKETLQKA